MGIVVFVLRHWVAIQILTSRTSSRTYQFRRRYFYMGRRKSPTTSPHVIQPFLRSPAIAPQHNITPHAHRNLPNLARLFSQVRIVPPPPPKTPLISNYLAGKK